MPQGDGYWVSPRGEAIRSGLNHIKSVINDPDLYGYTKADIQKIYKKYGEKLGTEGKAREEIIVDLVRRNWIRMRHYLGKGEFISLNVKQLNSRTADRITDFFSGWKGSKSAKFTPVRIGTTIGPMHELTVNGILNFKLYRLLECTRSATQTIIEWLEEPLSEDDLDRMRKRRQTIKGVPVLPAPEPINESVRQVVEEGGWHKAKLVLEGSLSRIVRHFAGGEPKETDGAIQIDPKAHFAILSSYRYPEGGRRDERLRKHLAAYSSGSAGKKILPKHLQNLRYGEHSDRKFNEAAYRRLLADVRNAGFGAIRLSGLWATGGQSIPYERSVMIVGQRRGERAKKPLNLGWMKHTAKKYHQYSFVYMGPETQKAHKGAAVLYSTDGKGGYDFERSWSMARAMTPEQIQKRLSDMRKAAQEDEPYADWGATVPKGSGKPSTFEDQPESKVQRTHRTGFVFDEPKKGEKVEESLFLAFWTELIYEGEAFNSMRINATLFHDPFHEEKEYIGGQFQY